MAVITTLAPAMKFAPAAGAVSDTVGGVFDVPAVTLTVTDAEVVVAPRLSVATAVST